MTTQVHSILTLNIENLLNGEDRYVIPVYQRNYAWQEAEITQLIQDIIDYIPKSTTVQDYYIGTLVTYEKKIGPELYFETIDGQQRVTTLTLLTSVIRHFYPEISLSWYKKINLEFESRKSSTDTLNHIYTHGKDFPPDYIWNDRIVAGFELCRELLGKKLNENSLSIQTFTEYLFSRVKIIRVTVPQDTDLNHYFEIMNNRGEQLEKHEILKSNFLELLNGLEVEEREPAIEVFNLVWEACSNMEKYIQYGFAISHRDAIFGKNDWNTLQVTDFFDLTQKLKGSLGTVQMDLKSLQITDIIQGKILKTEPQIEEAPERFNSVVNFPNFLLHVLRIYTHKDIPLDDKRLISTFEAEIKSAIDKIRFAEEFGFELLKCKFFFDKYIIKREFIGGIDRWSLKQLKSYKDNKVSYVNTFGASDDESNDENRTVLMLLSMFHVSTPTLVYKHWLNAALYFVAQKNDFIDATEYKNYLLATVRSFVFDRFLSKGKPKDYYEIIYKTEGIVTRDLLQLNLKKLVFNEGIENIVFNYLDFLLWERYKSKNKNINQFEFSFRSSVEHYYPRYPMPGYKQLKIEALDSFGNLCLISHSKNSRLSNQPPIAKRSHYKKQNLDSVKQWLMMEDYNADEWNEESISVHETKMKDILTESIDSDFGSIVSSKNNVAVSDNKAWRWFNQYKNEPQNMSLLARAIMSFGEIEVESGNSNYLDEWHTKYFLYDWDYIKSSEAFKLFCVFVEKDNPTGLSAIIKSNLRSNEELKNDTFRFLFVKHPEIWEYCEQGYYTWINNGENILLSSRERNTENSSIHLSILLVRNWVVNKYQIQPDYWREGFSIGLDYDSTEGNFIFDTEGGKGEIIIEWEEDNKIKCHVKPNRNAGNSIFVIKLQEFGWQIDFDSYYKRGASSTLISLSKNYEDDFNRAIEKLEFIFKNG